MWWDRLCMCVCDIKIYCHTHWEINIIETKSKIIYWVVEVVSPSVVSQPPPLKYYLHLPVYLFPSQCLWTEMYITPRFQCRASLDCPIQNIVCLTLWGRSLHVASIVDFELTDIYFQYVQISTPQIIQPTESLKKSIAIKPWCNCHHSAVVYILVCHTRYQV